jgi:hypothetical protein
MNEMKKYINEQIKGKFIGEKEIKKNPSLFVIANAS